MKFDVKMHTPNLMTLLFIEFTFNRINLS